MATSTKPVILILSIGEKWMQDMCDDPTSFGAGLDHLSNYADLKRARTAKGALSYLDKNAASPPDGILVTDPGVSQPGNKALLDRVVAYARAGGTVVMSYCFSSNIRMDDLEDFFKQAWGLPWQPGSYHRTDLTLNESASTLKGQVAALQKMYSQKAVFLKRVQREHAWYLPTEDSLTQSLVFAPEPVNQNETAVAFAPFGQGMVGYTGDVNMEAQQVFSFRLKALFLAAVFLASSVVLGIPSLPDVTETEANLFDPCEEPSTRHFDFTVTWAQNAPDGVERNMFMVNGQFPGPKLELIQGDNVVVKLRNSSPFNTTIHYHGIEMFQNPWSDGTPGISQGESSQQSGVDTPCLDSILVNGKGKVNCLSREQQAALITPNRQMLLSLVPGTVLTDKSCAPPSVITKLAAPGAPPPNYAAIPPEFFNGCSATEGSIEVINASQKSASDETWVMFDLISSLSLQQIQFSLDELTMYVIAADGNYTEPEAVQSLEIYNGQRYTLLAKLEQPKKYMMRISGTT
ncbi:hypothetical protein INS49_000720 [Diaporthe citri]|uniref:uncharacterized protein n=1 Tax=Diaporthe citri TaxID=83186 RepID=UPI001C81836F|nr:uncharacterized protein INS49_000720 [Diaporthe citri]KAG6366543.1 hypothetical protein INS49_000720 [Diaporthe citri]